MGWWTGWAAEAVRKLRDRNRQYSPRATRDQVLAHRQRLRGQRPAGQPPRWTVVAGGSGFAAVDETGRRAIGLARGAAAVHEQLAALADPAGLPSVAWASDQPAAPDGRLVVHDQPGLGDIEPYVAASHAQRERLRAAMPAVVASWRGADIDAQIRDRVRELDRAYPVLGNTIGHLGPDSLYPHDDLGRLRTFDWIEVDKVVGGGVDRWNDFDDHRPDTVPWIVRHVLNADDPAAAVLSAQADELHRHAELDRVPGPAGPIYEVINGRHRTHAMRILGVPLMVAEIVVRPLPVLVYQTAMREAGYPTYPAIPMWRGLMERGLLVGDIVQTELGLALQPYQVAASWLLLSPRQALIVSERYQRIYPGALGVPAEAFTSVDAWYRWCTA
jgi:hypothetical protein